MYRLTGSYLYANSAAKSHRAMVITDEIGAHARHSVLAIFG